MSSDEENEDGDFTVYECPGLAPVSPWQEPSGRGGAAVGTSRVGAAPAPHDPPALPRPTQTGEMEVRNPLFDHSSLSTPLPQ